MYIINYLEDGHFITSIGAPHRTLAECLTQISKLTDREGIKEMPTAVGCIWDRNGTTCALYITNEIGLPIETETAQ